jgi:hypothetical protein
MQMDYIVMPEPAAIRIHPSDVTLYNALMDEYQGKIKTHNDIVREYEKTCNRWELVK